MSYWIQDSFEDDFSELSLEQQLLFLQSCEDERVQRVIAHLDSLEQGQSGPSELREAVRNFVVNAVNTGHGLSSAVNAVIGDCSDDVHYMTALRATLSVVSPFLEDLDDEPEVALGCAHMMTLMAASLNTAAALHRARLSMG